MERAERPPIIVELKHKLEKEIKTHEQYNIGHEMPLVASHLRPEVRRKL